MEAMRFTRYVSVLVLLVAAVVTPATPAVAATPVITIDDVKLEGSRSIVVFGTVTCSQPTGQAHVEYYADNPHPIESASGVGETTVSCGEGPVPWAATAQPFLVGFEDIWWLWVSAQMRRDGVQEATTLRIFAAGWGD
jgi:hypothetical protein